MGKNHTKCFIPWTHILPAEKKYDAYVKHGKASNHYLIKRMLCNEPTKFYIPNIAVPLTDGDIAFMLLTDINCDGEYEKKLFPSFVTEKEGYSARYLFDYLHASDSNCIYVAQKLLEHYVEDKDGNLSFDIEYLSCKKFEDLYRTFESAKPLIENEADKKNFLMS